jgi:iron complex outermembrane recepter protein
MKGRAQNQFFSCVLGGLLLSSALLTAEAQESQTAAQQAAANSSSDTSNQLQEVVVTAQKRSEDVREVPISISVLGGAQLEDSHITNIDSLTRLAPSVSFAAGAGEGAGEGQQTIEIRGVSSNVGAATVGMYLDDVPITLPGEVGTALPKMFDMDRVEVLRGPQGTLYGSSSEGGTVRFITNQASTTDYQALASADVSYTEDGGLNDEYRAMLNAPLINDVLGLRVGFLYAENSGWIDRYGHPPTNIDVSDGQLLGSNINNDYDFAAKLAMTYKPTDSLTVTPFFYYQRLKSEDQPDFFLGQALYTQEASVAQPVRDTFDVSALTVNQSFGLGDLTLVSSYFWKEIYRQADGTYYDPEYVVPYILDPAIPAKAPIADVELADLPTTAYDRQTVGTLTEELRFASSKPTTGELPLSWVGGLYYSNNSYRLEHREVAPGWNSIFEQIYGFGPDNPVLSPVSDPMFPTLWAGDMFQRNYTLRKTYTYSSFGQINYDLWPIVHLSAGLRYDYTQLPYWRDGAGFFNVGNPISYHTEEQEHALTPKASITVDVTSDANVYASAAKGFRVGGVNNPVPAAICQQDYENLGISAEPASYLHDQLWTYEVGSKSTLLDRSLSIDGDVFYTRWSNIQQQIELPLCGYAYVSNVGDAAIKGGELQLRDKVRALGGLTFGLSGSIQNALITQSLSGSPAAVGEHVLYTPTYSAVASLDQDWIFPGTRKLSLHLDEDWTGPSYGSFVVGNPDYHDQSYSVLNANLSFSLGGSRLTLYSTNLLDNTTIIKHPEVNTVIEAYTVPPRIVGLKYEYSF